MAALVHAVKGCTDLVHFLAADRLQNPASLHVLDLVGLFLLIGLKRLT